MALARYDAAGARTDVLAILHRDWTAANRLDFSIAQAFFSWRDIDSTTLTLAANSSDNWDLLIHVKPTNVASDVDPAVTSRSSDYRIPSSIIRRSHGWAVARGQREHRWGRRLQRGRSCLPVDPGPGGRPALSHGRDARQPPTSPSSRSGSGARSSARHP